VTRGVISFFSSAFSLRCFLSALVSLKISSLAVEPAREHVDHCKKVFCEFCTASGLMAVVRIENDERCSSAGDNPFDKVNSEPGQTVSVGHHNLFDISALDESQKPLERFPLVVESRTNVLVDFIRGVLFLHRRDLPLEIVALLRGRHSTVDCLSSAGCSASSGFGLVRLTCARSSTMVSCLFRVVVELVDVEPAMTPNGVLARDESSVGP